jgi:8-oxo-dGTP pyrophosphatase MutT (NUDIX family)
MPSTTLSADALLAKFLARSTADAQRLAPLARQRPLGEAHLQRTTLPGHITASGFVVAQRTGRVLLIAHKRLGRLLQPGGHVEPGDASLGHAAAREVREETGVVVGDGQLIDIDIHTIPAGQRSLGGHEPEHDHYDFRFLFVVPDEGTLTPQDAEVHGCRWVPLDSSDALAALGERSIRNVRAGLARLGQPLGTIDSARAREHQRDLLQ